MHRGTGWSCAVLRWSSLAIALGVAGCGNSGEDRTCGEGTVDQGGTCVPAIECGEGTVARDGVCVPDDGPLEPAHFQAPLVQLQRLQGTESHMHIAQIKYREADKKLFYCSYTFGMIDASDPQKMRYRVEGLRHQTPSGSPRTPGCLHLAWDEDDPNLVYTSHRGNIDFAKFLSGWDLTDPAAPVQLPALQESGARYGGIDVENGLIYVTLQEDGLGIYDYDAEARAFTRLGTATGLHNAWNVVVRGNLAYVADGPAGLAIVDVTDPAAPVFQGRVAFGGNAEDLVVDGNVAYVAANSAGLILVDVTDPRAPAVIANQPIPGNAVGVAYHSGRAYVAGWNDVRAFDVSNPSKPRLIGATRQTVEQAYQVCTGDPPVCTVDDTRPDPTARTLTVAAFEDILFVGNWWVPYSFRVHPERTAPYLTLPEDVALIDFGPVEAGSTATREIVVKNEGNAPLTLYDNFTNNGLFAVSPAQVRIQPGASATLTVTFTSINAAMQRNMVSLRSDDPSQPLRAGYLVANQPGLGVGKPLPDVQATLMDGEPFSTAPLKGNVMLLAYFATF